MSRLKRDLYRKKLQEVLARADDESFFQMVWAIDALQSGRAEVASQYLRFPPEAANSDITSKYAMHKWELETLIGVLLTTPKYTLRGGLNRLTDCTHWDAAAKAVNYLRKVEAAEASIYLKRFSIMNEMHRTAQRQFPWQDGYFNVAQFYRYACIYGQGECANYFECTYGLTVSAFSLIGFILHTALQKQSFVKRQFVVKGIGITTRELEAAYKLLSMSISDARNEAVSLDQNSRQRNGAELPVSYQPSLLRRFPLVSFGNADERFGAPLPALIIQRVTSGVYYDLVNGASHLRNEASDRFEQYSTELFAAMMPRFDVSRSYSYKHRRNLVDTPDILIKNGGQIVIAVECKTTKLTIGAQFAEDPFAAAKDRYQEIVKGILQLWRYFSHARRGFANRDLIHPDVCGLVLTLDRWLMASPELQGQILSDAVMLANKDDEISAKDRRTVAFCSIPELEKMLAMSDEDSFMRTMAAAGEDRFRGWGLPGIHRELEGNLAKNKPYPFRLDDVLPWWKTLKES
jgi:hypothetical protein